MINLFKKIELYSHPYGVTTEFLTTTNMNVLVGGDWISDEEYDALEELFNNNSMILYRKDDEAEIWETYSDPATFDKFTSELTYAAEHDWLLCDPNGKAVMLFDAQNIFVVIASAEELKKVDTYPTNDPRKAEGLYLNQVNHFESQFTGTRKRYEHYRPFNIAK